MSIHAPRARRGGVRFGDTAFDASGFHQPPIPTLFKSACEAAGERFPAGVADFWSWRQAMYGLVERMDPDLAYQLAHRCYWEMLQAGIRTVGEFHYLRHQVLGDSDFAAG